MSKQFKKIDLLILLLFFISSYKICAEQNANTISLFEDGAIDQPIFIGAYRKDHHIQFTSFFVQEKWLFERKSPSINQGQESSHSMLGKIAYTYHIPVFSSFGYFLGSSFGYGYSSNRDSVDYRGVYHLPGFLGGFDYNFSQKIRLLFGFDFYIMMFDALVVSSKGAPKELMNLNLVSAPNFLLALDWFVNLKTAVRAEVHLQEIKYWVDKTFHDELPEVSISAKWFGFGVVYHVL